MPQSASGKFAVMEYILIYTFYTHNIEDAILKRPASAIVPAKPSQEGHGREMSRRCPSSFCA
jgi:hypothetical protein